MGRKPAVTGVDRRRQILEAALPVFAEQGFKAATNKESAKRAGVNQGLIYFYFESKADVFFAAFEYHAQLVLAQLDAVYEQIGNEAPAPGCIICSGRFWQFSLLRARPTCLESQSRLWRATNQEAHQTR
jgi:AcrR family transcriptional regulator